jgi:hypothetical protein
MNLSVDFEKENYFEDLASLIDQRFSSETLSRYHSNPSIFVKEIIKAEPTKQQEMILTALQKHRHLAVRSGHGIGKTACLAWVILWFMSTRPFAKIPCTAPSAHQLYDVLWAELVKWHSQMEYSFANKFDRTAEKFFHKQHRETWYTVARTARKENPEALQGFHGDNLLFILEEAAGIPDEIYQVSEGSLTSKENMVLACGNPTRINGFFYDCFHRDRKSWHTLHFKSTDSKLVDPKYPKRMADKYGKRSAVYQVRVLGNFPSAEDDQLIPLHLLEKAVHSDLAASGVVLWACDPARFGSDETALVKRKGDVIQEIKTVRNYDTMETTGWIVNQYNEAREKPSSILIDSIGIGSGVCDRLSELNLPVQGVNVAEAAKDNKKHANLRAELWCKYRDALNEGKLKIPDDNELIGQSSSIKYKFNSNGAIQIEAKEDLKKRGLASPDRADAVCLTFAYEGDPVKITVTRSRALDYQSRYAQDY